MKKLLQLVNLNKSFGGVHAVNELSFDVYEGEILGLIGPNGSGKSTCVNLISGVYAQDSCIDNPFPIGPFWVLDGLSNRPNPSPI